MSTELIDTAEQPKQPWLTPGVRGIGAASPLADAGHESSTSLLPAFLTSTLGAPASALGLMGDEASGRALDVAAGVVVAAGVGVGLAGLEHVPGNAPNATLFVAVVDAEVASQAA